MNRIIVAGGMVAACLMFSGCYSFRMGDEKTFESETARTQISVQEIDSVTPVLSFNTEVNGQRYFVLNLKAHGRFIRHDGKNVSSGKPVVTVGFFPGCVTARPFPCNVDFQRWIDIPVMAFFSNFAFLGLPTISAVFVEPFRDYYESPFSPRLMTDCALFGCRKHFEDVRYRSFSEKSRQIVSEVKLFAFKVEIDGKTYTDFDYGEGYDGRVVFATSRSRGSTVRMRIVGAPSTRGDSSDRLSDLVGIEMDAVLP